MGNSLSVAKKPMFYLALVLSILAAILAYLKKKSGFDNNNYLKDPNDYYSVYGLPITKQKQRSWIVVTGGSDALGLLFCEKLASHGFNICIIGNDKKNVSKRLLRIKEKNPESEVKYIQSMYGKLNVNRDYRELA